MGYRCGVKYLVFGVNAIGLELGAWGLGLRVEGYDCRV